MAVNINLTSYLIEQAGDDEERFAELLGYKE